MYRHHFRVKPDDKLGWLRNMFFGLSQQLLCQDHLYYALYCALWPDHEWKLIAYPYYAKYQVPGDNTAFRHINANTRDLADLNRSSGFIQGTLSLDQEDSHNCTILVLGMHKHLQEWYQQCVEGRGLAKDGKVQRIHDQMLTNISKKTCLRNVPPHPSGGWAEFR